MPFEKDWLIIANGEPLPKEQMLLLAQDKALMVLDGAFTREIAEELQPELVLGDFDSIEKNTQNAFVGSKALRFVQVEDQSQSDLEKGLYYLIPLKPKSVTIINASGWRLDHTLYNLGLLKRFHGQFKSLLLMTAQEKIFYIQNQTVILEGPIGQALALLSFPQAKVNSSGLVYELQNLNLQLGGQEGPSNALALSSAQLEVQGAVLLLVAHGVVVEVQS